MMNASTKFEVNLICGLHINSWKPEVCLMVRQRDIPISYKSTGGQQFKLPLQWPGPSSAIAANGDKLM